VRLLVALARPREEVALMPGAYRIYLRRAERVRLRGFYDQFGRFHNRCICFPYGDNDGSAHFPLCPKGNIPKFKEIP
jgi:hypothetical protein